MLALSDLLAQEVLGGFPGRRGETLAHATGVAVIHEPDVALCSATSSDARQDLSPLSLSCPARLAGACLPAPRWGVVLRARHRRALRQKRDEPDGGAAHPLCIRLPLRHRHRVHAKASRELVLSPAESLADAL